jgi:hypothetical protein
MHSESRFAREKILCNFIPLVFFFMQFQFLSFLAENKNKMMALHKPHEIFYYDFDFKWDFNSSIIECVCDCEAMIAIFSRTLKNIFDRN